MALEWKMYLLWPFGIFFLVLVCWNKKSGNPDIDQNLKKLGFTKYSAGTHSKRGLM
jgi:hypothetical protein